MSCSEEKIITDDRLISGEKTDTLENLGLSKYEMSKKKSLLSLMIITISYATHIHIDNILLINKFNKSNPSAIYNPISFLFLQISVIVLILLTKRVFAYKQILLYSYIFLTITVIALPISKSYISKDYSNYVICSILMFQGVISVIIECHLLMIVNNFTKNFVLIMTLGEPLYGLLKWGFNFLKICNFSKPKNKSIANFAESNFIVGLFYSLLSLSLLRLMYKNEYFIKRLIQIGEIKPETNTNTNINKTEEKEKEKEQFNSKDFSASDNSTYVSSKRSSKESVIDEESEFLILKYVNEIEDNILYESNDNSTISLKNDLDNLFTNSTSKKKYQSKENKNNNNNNDDLVKGLNNKKSNANNNHFMKCSLNFAKDNEEDIIIHIDNSNEALNKFSLSIAPLFIKSLNFNICLALNNLITYSIFPNFLIGNYSTKKFTYSIFSMLFYLFDLIGRKATIQLINAKGKLILLTYLRLFLMFLIIIFRLHITNNICTVLVIFLFGFLHGMGNSSSVIISQNGISNSYLKEKSAVNICLFQLIGLLIGITLNKTFISSFRKLLI